MLFSFKRFFVWIEVVSLFYWFHVDVWWERECFETVMHFSSCSIAAFAYCEQHSSQSVSLACQNDLIAFTWKFNWHLIESKCDVNWHEFVSKFDVRIASHRAYVTQTLCSSIYWENRYDLCYIFLLKSFFTISAANLFHETWSQQLKCLLFVIIESEVTQPKIKRPKQKENQQDA